MDIFFTKSKLQKTCNSEALLRMAYGQTNSALIRHRLAVLEAAASLAYVPTSPPERCRLLKGDFARRFAVDAQHPFRIVFEPSARPPPVKPDGGLDLREVTAITILDIVDYH